MDLLARVWGWLEAHPEVIWGVTIGSVALLVVGLVALPFVLVRLPADYFVRERKGGGHVVVRVVRNIFGAVVLLAGFLMLALPGQGLLTVLAGVLLLDFPGKRRLELAIVRRDGVRRGVDWIREKAGRPKLDLPDG